MKDIFSHLREKTKRIVKEGLHLAKRKKMPDDYCSNKCASCLAAEAREIVDEQDFEYGFDSQEDVCMFEARNELAEKLGWKIR